MSDVVVERMMVDGRDATVSYLTRDFAPATRDTAEMLKVTWDDGNTAFLMRTERSGPELDPAN